MPSCFCPADGPHPHTGLDDHGDHPDAPDDVVDAEIVEGEVFAFAPLLVVRDPADLLTGPDRHKVGEYLNDLQEGLATHGEFPQVLLVPAYAVALEFEVIR
jgi:hypothetical protein